MVNKGHLRRVFVFIFELWVAVTLALLLLAVLANTWRSAEMPPLEVGCNCSQIGIASSLGSEEVTATTSSNSTEPSFADLAQLLPKVATEDKTVIITSVNEAFARPNSLLGLFRESFVAGEKIAHLLDHVLVVAVDPAAFHHCKAVHPHCYHLKVNSMNLSNANNFMSEAYVELVWTKLSLQQRVLELGYNFLFTDVDILWFRDPFRHISVFADMTTSSDVFNGDDNDLKNWPNTGFYYVKSTNRTVEMLRRWQAARARYPPNHEQNIFNFIKHDLAAGAGDGGLGVRVRFLDTAVFAGFCQLFSGDMARACTMHANCCVGLDNKLHDLRSALDQWRNYTSGMLPEAGKTKSDGGGRRVGWSVPAKYPRGDGSFETKSRRVDRSKDASVATSSADGDEERSKRDKLRGRHTDEMGLGDDLTKLINRNHVLPFLAGAVLPTLLLLMVLANDRAGEQQLAIVSSWGNNGGSSSSPPAHDIRSGAAADQLQPPEKFPGLAELLPKLAMEDKTVILTSVNEAWATPGSLLDLYLDSYKNGEGIAYLLDHVLVVAVDPAGFRRCKVVHPHCYHLEVKDMNLSSAKSYMTKGYIDLVWTKLSLQQRVLELGYNLLFTDCDMVLFRDPFRHINLYADMTTSSDVFYPTRPPLSNPLNTGLYYMKATNRSISLLQYWQAARPRFPNDHDQTVFGHIKHELVSKLQARIEPLDTVYFPGFCEYYDDFDKVVNMHGNCCIGLDIKLHDLMDIATDWRNYTSLSLEERKKGGLKWTYPKRNHVVPFLAGAALPTLLLFLLASDRMSDQLAPIVSDWGIIINNGTGSSSADDDHGLSTGAAADQQPQEKFPGLAKLLLKVAMEDKTVILTSVNEAWAAPGSFLDLYRESFKNGEGIAHLLDHVLVVAVDPAGFRHCKAVHPYCYHLEVQNMNLSSAKSYMTKGYIDLVWTKLLLQQHVLELGYNFLFTDCDMVLFRDPFRYINLYADMATSCNVYYNVGPPLNSPLNTGFYYIKATNRSISMLRYWQAARLRFPNDHDQTVFDNIKHELVAKIHARIEPLDTVYFAGFCEYYDDFDKVVTMHATCCIGLDNKLHDLRDVATDWGNYTRLLPETAAAAV
uniref:Nucleotide-diphospho-sugar transferase domain-containing protein n=1 Tax=Leersia perrieri TaxID=77586 RepID=A0A0D9V9L9_9ORYZ